MGIFLVAFTIAIETRFLIEFEVLLRIEEQFGVENSVYRGCFQLGFWGLQVLENGLRTISMVVRAIGIDWVVLEESQVIL